MDAPSRKQPVVIDAVAIQTLDLRALNPWMERPLINLLGDGAGLELQYNWPRDADDPRELSECPEPRLWALRADAVYPWLPLVLERSGGSLIQHVAMVVPHDFSPSEGIRFDPQALEIWITHRFMLLDHLGQHLPQSQRGNLLQMAATIGYEVDAAFWTLLDQR
ncbi:MAG: CRR6 family NdhI maturation factor [Synechococcus sp. BS30m-G30]|nr:CRR6 family NdhI maturation factor [Synechococcus sp.]MBL6887364.1 CRR6 family NdhI maturation factor [Synechococcus sp. BS30m-G30]